MNPSSHALVRAVSPHLDRAELTFLEREPVDVGRARAQHAGYVDLLERLGHIVVPLPETPELPDATFVEDAVVVVDDLAVLMRSGAESRRPEPASVVETVTSLGLRTAHIEAPGTMDGGDVLQVGRTVYVGTGGRTDGAGIGQLRRHLAPLGRTVVTVPVLGCLHLKSGATALPDGTVITVAGWVDVAPFLAAGLEVVEVPEVAGADVVLSGERVVMSAAAPRTAALVRARGFEVYPVQISELEKAECGPTCLSVLLSPPNT